MQADMVGMNSNRDDEKINILRSSLNNSIQIRTKTRGNQGSSELKGALGNLTARPLTIATGAKRAIRAKNNAITIQTALSSQRQRQNTFSRGDTTDVSNPIGHSHRTRYCAKKESQDSTRNVSVNSQFREQVHLTFSPKLGTMQ